MHSWASGTIGSSCSASALQTSTGTDTHIISSGWTQKKALGKGIHPTDFPGAIATRLANTLSPSSSSPEAEPFVFQQFFTALSTLRTSWSKSPRASLYPVAPPLPTMANRTALSLSPWPRGSAGRAKTPFADRQNIWPRISGQRGDHHSLKSLLSLPTMDI